MSTPTPPPPAGWYPDSQNPEGERWWDGQAWTAHTRPKTLVALHLPAGLQTDKAQARQPFVAVGTQQGRSVKNTSATLALVFGIVSMLLNVIFVPMLLAIVFAVLGLVKARRLQREGHPPRGRKRSVWGIILAGVATFIAILFIANIANHDPPVSSGARASEPPVVTAPSEPPSSPATAIPTPIKTATSVPTAKPTTPPATPTETYKKLTTRELAQIVRDPDAAVGDRVVLFGVVTQADAITGVCAMLASVGTEQDDTGFDYALNAYFVAGDGVDDCPVLRDVVEGDHVRLEVTGDGSLAYDTQAGGTTTVPLFQVDSVKMLDAVE